MAQSENYKCTLQRCLYFAIAFTSSSLIQGNAKHQGRHIWTFWFPKICVALVFLFNKERWNQKVVFTSI